MSSLRVLLVLCLPAACGSCGIFETRTPQEPSQSSLNYSPPTDPTIVISNLESAIDDKNVANYISCFSDAAKTGRAFTFTPSADAVAQYPSILNSWTYGEEQAYFQNLVSRSPTTAFSSLVLTLKSSVITSDSVVYNYDYTFTFDHTDPGFPKTARGNLQFTIVPDNTNFWSICTWSDFKTTSDITWSYFKGRFSN